MVGRSSSHGTAAVAVRTTTGTPGAASLRILAMLSAAALATAVVVSPAEAASGPVICPLRLLTGLPCPGCGLTRAWVFAAHGDLGQALSANPFVLVTIPAALVLVLAVGAALVRRRPPPDLRPMLSSIAVQGLLVVWVLFAVARAGAVVAGVATI